MGVLNCALILVVSACQRGNAVTPFNNPLLETDGADPWMLYHDGNYYLTATQWSSIRMWKSPTVAGLATVEPVTIWSDPNPARCCNVWAPEFHLLDGPNGPRWYVYYSAGTDGTLDNQRTHVLESSGTDPLGPYTYKGRIFDPQHDTWAIDGSILKMPDRKLYFLFSAWEGPNQNMYIAPMSDPWTISGSRVLLSSPTYDWEKKLANVNEGPEALQRDGKIFIIYSASACWGPDYKLGMLTYTGGDVLKTSSWVKSPTPVFQRSDANGVFAPGHNGFFTSPDGKEHWIVYHANSSATDGCTGVRTTRVQKFTWNEDGTPNFGPPVALDTRITPPSGERGAPPPAADVVAYSIVNRQSGQCLVAAGGASTQEACDGSADQLWSVNYLGNGYHSLINRDSGKALEVAGGPEAKGDGAALDQATWTHNDNQEWRLLVAADGWLNIEARHSDKVIDVGQCATGGSASLKQTTRGDTPCQQFRLQPVGEVTLVNANSTKTVAVDKGSTEDGAAIVLSSAEGEQAQRWKFVHQENGYYQVVAALSQKCLAAAGSTSKNVAGVDQRSCARDTTQQWRVEPLNDGSVRLMARSSSRVLDVLNCGMADGTKLQQWVWMNNPCQHFRIAAP
jgi:GH43 family beta-xylosidase